MKTIAMPISQNWNRSRSPLVSAPMTHRAEHRPQQTKAPAHRGPDHQVGREAEAAELRRHQALLRRVERAADAGEEAAHAEGHRLQPVGVEAEEHDPALVVSERAQSTPSGAR